MSEWYYADARRERLGPVAAGVIRDKFRNGELDLATLAWCEGMTEWKPLSAVADELQLLVQANTGIDLRADYTAIEKGTASYSPYAASAATLQEGSSVVQGGNVVFAGFWRRVAAYFVDWTLLTIASYAILIPTSIVVTLASSRASSGGTSIAMILLTGVVYLVLIAFNIMYPAWMHASRYQATLGKMVVGIKVVRSDGERISLGRGVGRIFATILSSLILCIGYLMAAFTERKQCLHDMVCDTLVVDRWAYTERPEQQKQGLGTATIVILSIAGLLLILGIFGMVALITAIATGSH